VSGSATVDATLETQHALSTALPIRLRNRTGLRKRDFARLRRQQTHGRSFPRSSTSVKSAPEPPPVHIATSAS
jgi:hypothetical protein